MRIKYKEPPLDAPTVPAPGFAAFPSTYPTPSALVNEIIQHDDSLDGDWLESGPDPSNASRKQIPVGFHHVAKHGRAKTNWALDTDTFACTCADRAKYLKMFARQGARLDTNLCFNVFANLLVFVSWATDLKAMVGASVFSKSK